VSCKHFAKSKKKVSFPKPEKDGSEPSAVGTADEINIERRLRKHKCDAFMGFYSTLPANWAATSLGDTEHKFYHCENIIGHLLKEAWGPRIAGQFMPISYEKWVERTKCVDFSSRLLPLPQPSGSHSLDTGPKAVILAVAFLEGAPMHYEIRAYEWRESAFVELAESLCREVTTIQLDTVMQDWPRIAQAIVVWLEEAKEAKGNEAKHPLVELLLPGPLLLELIAADFLGVRCFLPDEDEFIPCKFASCCPVVVRPLRRYTRHNWQSKAGNLFGKYQRLVEGHGKWVHRKDADNVDGVISKYLNHQDAALQLVSDLPADSVKEWLGALIKSNIPLALWWHAAGAHAPEARQEHFRQYKKDNCLLLDPGDAQSVAIRNAEDLESLPRLRMELSTHPLASSMVLFSDNPHRVPDLPCRADSGGTPASSSSRSV
jgi:hypothetical protein